MIREYKAGDLTSGYIGLRVAVSVGGKLKQKYFPNSKYAYPTALLLAKKTERTWFKMQLRWERNNVFSKDSNTGIRGLCYAIDTHVKENGKSYSYPIISYQYKHKNKQVMRTWCDTGCIPKTIWQEICLLIKNTRTLSDHTYEKLLVHNPEPRNKL